MLLPWDSDEPKHAISWATHGLILANIAVFAFAWGPGHGETTLRWAFDPRSPGLLTCFTSMFLHAGFLHLLGNMVFLHVAGRPLEWRLGRLPFLGLYFASGLIADLAHALTSAHPAVGASGAIAGLMGAWLWLLPDAQVTMVLIAFARIVTFEARALWLLVFWVVAQVVFARLAPGGVAYGAHIGGFAAGFVLALVVSRIPSLVPEHVKNEGRDRLERLRSLGAWRTTARPTGAHDMAARAGPIEPSSR